MVIICNVDVVLFCANKSENGNKKYVEHNQYFVCTTRRLASYQALFFQYRNNPNNTPQWIYFDCLQIYNILADFMEKKRIS